MKLTVLREKRFSNQNPLALLSLGCLLALIAGCGGGGSSEDLVELVPVSGTVTIDGVPTSNLNVTFMPAGSGMGRPCYAATDENGTFTLKDGNGREGCPVGQFKVVISKFAREDGTPFGADVDGATAAAEGKEHLPPKYSDATQTELMVNVPAGGSDFPFDLEI